MLTIFTIPKPFKDHIEIIQRNAIQSWSLLRPACEIILCGDDPGTADVAAEFGARYLPNIARNEYGTPLLNSAFEQVAQAASHRLLCYVNADIILLNDFIEAIQRIQYPEFLMVGRRRNVDIKQYWGFERSGWEERLRLYVKTHETSPSQGGLDYFVFPRNGEIEKLPPFAVGRPGWDRWFISRTRKAMHIPIIDVSRATTVIHQNHDYNHVPQQRGDRWQGPEGDSNMKLLGHLQYTFTLSDVTHILTPEALLPAYWVLIRERGIVFYLRRRLYTMQILVPATKPLIEFIRGLAHRVRDFTLTKYKQRRESKL